MLGGLHHTSIIWRHDASDKLLAPHRSGRADRTGGKLSASQIDRELIMDELAGAAGLTRRTFARRLKAVCNMSPVRFAQTIRSEIAITLLETTKPSVDEISRRVGYAEPSTLRRLLRRESGCSPSGFRRSA